MAAPQAILLGAWGQDYDQSINAQPASASSESDRPRQGPTGKRSPDSGPPQFMALGKEGGGTPDTISSTAKECPAPPPAVQCDTFFFEFSQVELTWARANCWSPDLE